MKRALLLVDPQEDFINGSLPVQGAEAAMQQLAVYLPAQEYSLKIVTCDSHPWTHCSFKENGGQWPRHCVSHSHGAAIWPGLIAPLHESPGLVHILPKGIKPDREAYSIFEEEAGNSAIKRLFSEVGIEAVDICGIAGDICVLNTLRDGIGIYGNHFFNVLKDFSPSLDGGASLAAFCAKENICAR